ncbi:hypothetical protein ACFVH6_25545 [Spirillospora sp. NPDC127200]
MPHNLTSADYTTRVYEVLMQPTYMVRMVHQANDLFGFVWETVSKNWRHLETTPPEAFALVLLPE